MMSYWLLVEEEERALPELRRMRSSTYGKRFFARYARRAWKPRSSAAPSEKKGVNFFSTQKNEQILLVYDVWLVISRRGGERALRELRRAAAHMGCASSRGLQGARSSAAPTARKKKRLNSI